MIGVAIGIIAIGFLVYMLGHPWWKCENCGKRYSFGVPQYYDGSEGDGLKTVCGKCAWWLDKESEKWKLDK